MFAYVSDEPKLGERRDLCHPPRPTSRIRDHIDTHDATIRDLMSTLSTRASSYIAASPSLYNAREIVMAREEEGDEESLYRDDATIKRINSRAR